MKAFLLLNTLLITLSTASFEISEYKIESQLSLKLEHNNPYDTCFELLERIVAEAAEISILITNKEWTKLLPLLGHLLKHIYDDVECFMHPNNNGSDISDIIECLKEHFIHIKDSFQKIIEGIKNNNIVEIMMNFVNIVVYVKDIPECFRDINNSN